MTYNEALVYLDSLNKFGIRLGLERISGLLALMGNPEQAYKTVHVTGTNGKGSTTAILTAALFNSGLKTGMYTSPHLTHYTERIKIGETDITREDFAAAISYTKSFVERLIAAGGESPTQFEVLTAAAFYHFAAAGVEYAVIEVGLGGLLDSTNVIVPEVAIITNVTLEHADRCGGTLQGVAEHKAGIIKPAVPVVTAVNDKVLPVLETRAQTCQSRLYVLGRDFTVSREIVAPGGQRIAVHTQEHGEVGPAMLALPGRHQAANAALAVMAALLLARRDERITADAIVRGLACVFWPGRLEIIPRKPLVVIDGAHNPAGARVLRETLDELFPGRPVVFLLGILADKDIAGITGQLIRATDSVVVTTPASERAATPEAVARMITAGGKVALAASPAEGLAAARQLAGNDGIVCIAGSLYLIGSIRPVI